jgi:hypothetical protein
MVYVTPDKLGW